MKIIILFQHIHRFLVKFETLVENYETKLLFIRWFAYLHIQHIQNSEIVQHKIFLSLLDDGSKYLIATNFMFNCYGMENVYKFFSTLRQIVSCLLLQLAVVCNLHENNFLWWREKHRTEVESFTRLDVSRDKPA